MHFFVKCQLSNNLNSAVPVVPTCRKVPHSQGWSRSSPCTEGAACWSRGSWPGSSGSRKVCWRSQSWSLPSRSWCCPAPRTSCPWRSRRSRSASPASSPVTWAAPGGRPAAGISRLDRNFYMNFKQIKKSRKLVI